MKNQTNEIRRMQQLAGILKESVENSAVEFLNQHKEEIYDEFHVFEIYGVPRKRFLQGNFIERGPFMFHDVEGHDGSSIEFTLEPNEERNISGLRQKEVEVGGKKFYLTTVTNY